MSRPKAASLNHLKNQVSKLIPGLFWSLSNKGAARLLWSCFPRRMPRCGPVYESACIFQINETQLYMRKTRPPGHGVHTHHSEPVLMRWVIKNHRAVHGSNLTTVLLGNTSILHFSCVFFFCFALIPFTTVWAYVPKTVLINFNRPFFILSWSRRTKQAVSVKRAIWKWDPLSLTG